MTTLPKILLIQSQSPVSLDKSLTGETPEITHLELPHRLIDQMPYTRISFPSPHEVHPQTDQYYSRNSPHTVRQTMQLANKKKIQFNFRALRDKQGGNINAVINELKEGLNSVQQEQIGQALQAKQKVRH